MNQIINEINNTIQQPYSNVYNSDSFQIDLNDPLREVLFFLPDQSIQIKIIDHEVEPAIVNLLHTNVYTISVKHAQFSWTIKRKYKNFLKLYEAYALFKTKLNIRNATHTNNLPQITNPTPNETTTTTTATAAASNSNRFKSSDHFKLFFQSIASDFTHSKHILEKFLQDVVDNKIFRNHNETLKFLEVSHLSFVSELGDKNKEGLIKKHAFSIRFCSSASSSLNYFCATRWLIVKDTWIAYLEPKTGEIRTVLLVDKLFRVQSGLAGTGERSGLLIENLSKNLFVKCYNEKRANEWRYAIQYMLDSTGQEFCSPARFESFAPVRYGCKTRWFVDGADYMESIADSIQSATEEIFITGFFLSPEIYLKRPVLVGDKWRLDKLLKQKAEQGVKIYVLIYKEIEITLPINSAYSKRTLSHKNIKVLRHPDHLNGPIMWAHHEKLVIIDQSVAYFGGIDLCYGRWDDHCHRLTDLGSVISSSTTSSSSSSSNSPKQIINSNFQLASIDETTLIPTVPIESVSSSTRSKLSKENNSVRLLKFDTKRPHLSSIFSNSETINSTPTNPDENNNKTETTLKPLPETAEELNSIKTKLKKLKPMRMLSTPTPVSNESESEILSRNFLIDNMTDYYNNFIKKDSSNIYCENENESENTKKENKTSRFERLFNRVEHLKRSKSLELSNVLAEERIETNCVEPKLLMPIRDESQLVNTSNLTHSLKALHQHQQQQQRETFAEHSIFNKLKKIKQFKENLRRYAIPSNDNNNNNDANVSQEIEDEKLISALNSTKTNQGNQLINSLQGSTKLWIGKDYCNFIFKDVKNVHSPFQDSINRTTTPRMPWHDIAGCVYGSAARDIARHFIERWNYIKTKKMRNNKTYFQLVPKSYQNIRVPNDSFFLANTTTSSSFSTCNVQTLRSVSTWSAGISKTETSIHNAMKHLIRTSKHYIYIENQFFISLIDDNLTVRNEIALCIYDRILRAVNEKENFKVYVFLPLIPGYEGEYGKLKSSGVLLHTITHYNNATINGLIKKLTDASIDPLNYIFFFGLRTWSELNNRLITEIIYVHSKLMIVDDRACIIGSANINDRSLLGSRDSEVALYIEDTQFKTALLNKKPTQVGLFASSLRHRLFKEFLGELNTSSVSNEFIDPCSDEFYKQVLIKHASQNTHIYDLVFKVIPCDYVSNFEQLREYQKLACLNQTDTAKAREELKRVKGYVVLYPNRFLVHQDLTPPLGTKEKLLPTILWT